MAEALTVQEKSFLVLMNFMLGLIVIMILGTENEKRECLEN